ncbi:coiled-coil domain-containing protein 93 [Dendroctonus ponderosae]|uniref:coiled-coil domain-containing protein 93 n=1 Tax=Dendroctonus ponderosae TaxID=77166 RepID=UPI002035FAA7|nr:coiled-coil domain-containing protein 93 [Dendroctonus ponderosae]KAH1003232.1 hypothetical protein HUJ05_011165 [Dendroctonus ponderosae]
MAQVNQELLQRFQRASVAVSSAASGAPVHSAVLQDEEQSRKLQEIVDLLVAAGYFRARIKGLSPFDKVVGGLSWCLEALSVDLDVDLLFQENATIGQQIALSEKIVAVLPRVQCPHRIEPHQVQGLDLEHVFPVVQWLVKASMEAREQNCAQMRNYALLQFRKEVPEWGAQPPHLHMLEVEELYRPQRRLKRKGPAPPDVKSRVLVTLQEYEPRGAAPKPEHLEEVPQAPPLNEAEQAQVRQHYQALSLELQEAAPQAQLLERCAQQRAALQARLLEEQRLLQETRDLQQQTERARAQLDAEEQQMDRSAVLRVEALVLHNEALKRREADFKAECRAKLQALQGSLAAGRDASASDMEELRLGTLKARRQLANRNRTVARLHRIVDDVPCRAELAQYQHRFLDLYDQVAAKHKETKQYYSLYNSLEDQRRYMRKELGLLNSVADNYPRAMETASGREEFLQQLHGIVDGLKLNRLKLEQQVQAQRALRDHLAEALQQLLEHQRGYVAAVNELSELGRSYTALLQLRE